MGQYPSSILPGDGPPLSPVDDTAEREAQASNGLRRRRSTDGSRPDIKRQCSLGEGENHSEEDEVEDEERSVTSVSEARATASSSTSADSNASSDAGANADANAGARSGPNNSIVAPDTLSDTSSTSEGVSSATSSLSLGRRSSDSVSPLSAAFDLPLDIDTPPEHNSSASSSARIPGPSLSPNSAASPSPPPPLLGARSSLLNQNSRRAPGFSLRDWPSPAGNVVSDRETSTNTLHPTHEPLERNTLDPELEFFDAPSSFNEFTSLLRGTAAAAAAAATTMGANGPAAAEGARNNPLPRPPIPRVAPFPLPPPLERPPPPPRHSYLPELALSRARARTPEEEEVMVLLGMLRSAAIVTADHLVGSQLVHGELYRGTTATAAVDQPEQQQQQQQQQSGSDSNSNQGAATTASAPESAPESSTESSTDSANESATESATASTAPNVESAAESASPPRVVTFADFLEQLRNGTHTDELMQLMFDTTNATNFFRFFRFPHDRDGRVPILLLGIRSAEVTGGRDRGNGAALREENELFGQPLPDRIPETPPNGRRRRHRRSLNLNRNSPAAAPRRSNPLSELFEDDLFDGTRLNEDRENNGPEDRVDDLLARLYRGVNRLHDNDEEDDEGDDEDNVEGHEDEDDEDYDDEESDEGSIFDGHRRNIYDDDGDDDDDDEEVDMRFDRGVWMDALRDVIMGEPSLNTSRAPRAPDLQPTHSLDDGTPSPSESPPRGPRSRTSHSAPDTPSGGTFDGAESGAEDARPETNARGRRRRSRRSWVIYVIGGSYPPNHPIFTARSLQTDHPTYEDMLLVEQLLGYGKPSVATKDDIASAGGTSTLGPDSPLLSERCPICLTDYMEGDVCRTLSCKHTFHQECVDSWLMKSHNSCPMCRHEGVPGKNSVHSSA